MDSQATSTGTFPTFLQPSPISFPQGTTGLPVRLYQSKIDVQKFLRANLKLLGIIQIMNGLMIFTLGILTVPPLKDYYPTTLFLLYSYYVFGGSALFIISGSLSIVAEIRTTDSLVLSSLATNAVSLVVATSGIILLSIGLYHCSAWGDSYYGFNLGTTLLLRINVILLILTLLEFALFIAVSVFGFKAISSVQRLDTFVIPPSSHVPENPC